ncbi:MAG: gamma-glutamylcyclotransferase [Rhodobiaceae bacterium]|nr:gamma-glutamylcyclotransferase [Rhodobiaceae bacterium]MCC0056824.1 gamma-glutamylcyclotransferase [Rhodobiaceae bacterium]
MREYWVFGYGSLMWKPGFAFIEQQPARLHGYHRALCVYSWVHRGTPDHPGLVLGLDRGGSCRGMAFRVAEQQWADVVAYLREREQVTMVYREESLKARLIDQDRVVGVLAYVVDRSHAQYAGVLTPHAQAKIVSSARGKSGENREYVENTLAHMRDEGIRDERLASVGTLLADA